MIKDKETTKNDLTRILIEAVIKPASPIKSILKEAKKRIKAEDARFRLRGWQDQSVVYTPGWIIGPGLDEAPELARRVYYDPNEPSRMDCIVGLVARIARIKEEEAKKESNNEFLQKLKEGVSENQIIEQRICFNDISTQKVFKEFIARLQEETNIWLKKAEIWENYLKYLEPKAKVSKSFFSNAFSKNAPWEKESDAAEKTKGQWKQLEDYIKKKKKRGSEVREFLDAVKKTADRYRCLYEQWEKYTSSAKIPKCEIAVPVVAFGKFLGVLNFHKKDEFSENDEHLARTYATQLAVACLQRQAEQFEEFQKVARLMAAESNFELIASKIAEGIRIRLRDGLKNNEVFPVLYVANQPIDRSDNLTDDEFEKIWEETYHRRQQPRQKDKKDYKLWTIENVLGSMPIRPKGLGRAVVEKWRLIEKGSTSGDHLFIDSLDVDDPNSETGSRSALNHHIKTTGCLPLIFEHRVYGLLYLHCTKRHFFTDAELHALETSGTQVAVAINNARLIGSSYVELYGSKILDLLTGSM